MHQRVATVATLSSIVAALAIAPDRAAAGPTATADEPRAASAPAAAPSFPARRGPAALPGADRLRGRIATEPGGAVTARVRVCVAPSGAVTDVALLASSGLPAFDRAVVDGVAAWTYQPFAAPATVRVCRPLAVAYRAR